MDCILIDACFAFVNCDNVVMSLTLPLSGGKERGELFSEEFCRTKLVRFWGLPDPKQVEVVGHQAIDRRRELIAGAGVAQELTELCVKCLAERQRLPVLGGMRPKDVSESAVEMLRQPGEFSFHAFKTVRCKSSDKVFCEY